MKMIRRKTALCYIGIMGVMFTALTLMNLWMQIKDDIKSRNTNGVIVKQILNFLPIKINKNITTAEISFDEFLQQRGNVLPQKCKIPVLDPYHPDIKSSIKRWTVPECRYPGLSEVTDDGLLQVSFYIKTAYFSFFFCLAIMKREKLLI